MAQPRSPGPGPTVSADENLRAGTDPAANSSEETSAAELERQARALEGAAVKAAAAARAARATANGRSQGQRDDGDDPARRAGELERQANDLYDEALRARLRADAAAEEVRPDIPSAPPEEAPAGSEELPVVTCHRRELDWTTLLEAAIADHPAVPDPQQDNAAPQAGPARIKVGFSDETKVATPPSPR